MDDQERDAVAKALLTPAKARKSKGKSARARLSKANGGDDEPAARKRKALRKLKRAAAAVAEGCGFFVFGSNFNHSWYLRT
jgi:hypothetical protein